MFVCERDVQALTWTHRNVSGLLLAESSFPCSLMKDWKAKRGLPWLFLAVASLFKQWLDAFWRNKRKHMDWISPKHTTARSGLEARCGREGRRESFGTQARKLSETRGSWEVGRRGPLAKARCTLNQVQWDRPFQRDLGIPVVYDGTYRRSSYCIGQSHPQFCFLQHLNVEGSFLRKSGLTPSCSSRSGTDSLGLH